MLEPNTLGGNKRSSPARIGAGRPSTPDTERQGRRTVTFFSGGVATLYTGTNSIYPAQTSASLDIYILSKL